MVSELVCKHNKSYADIRKMTRYQIRHHFFRPRDEHGNLMLRNKPEPVDYENDIFRPFWRDRGATEAEIDNRWKAYLKEQAEQKAKESAVIRTSGEAPSPELLARMALNA